MIEFALVLPVLLIVLLGTVEFSFLLYNKAMITNASREGARLGIVYDFGSSGTYTHLSKDEIDSQVQNYLSTHLVTFANPKPSFTPPDICRIDAALDPTDPAATCMGYGAEKPGDFLRVTVNYTYDFLIIDILPRILLPDKVNLKAVTIMRFE